MKWLILTTFWLTGCSTLSMPTKYGQWVMVVGGEYKGLRGKLVDDSCSGFEEYRVQLFSKTELVCIRIWNLESYYE